MRARADELVTLLDEAIEVVSGFSVMSIYCGYDTSAAELRCLRERVARQDWSALGPLVGIFTPTGPWDEGVPTAKSERQVSTRPQGDFVIVASVPDCQF